MYIQSTVKGSGFLSKHSLKELLRISHKEAVSKSTEPELMDLSRNDFISEETTYIFFNRIWEKLNELTSQAIYDFCEKAYIKDEYNTNIYSESHREESLRRVNDLIEQRDLISDISEINSERIYTGNQGTSIIADIFLSPESISLKPELDRFKESITQLKRHKILENIGETLKLLDQWYQRETEAQTEKSLTDQSN